MFKIPFSTTGSLVRHLLMTYSHVSLRSQPTLNFKTASLIKFAQQWPHSSATVGQTGKVINKSYTKR